ncbi:MAG TPA: hypothetical protein VHT70_02010 [Candidatus Saccharimonadales bacterium]|nr:hypothetical protein [Candidatus Saccharimonadales bacterium]
MNPATLRLERVPGNPGDLPYQALGELALLYANVFAGPPWNEYTTCSEDGTFFGSETQPGNVCPQPDCRGELRLAYPVDQTKAYVAGELLRPDAALWLLRDTADQNRMVGFSWGFSYPDLETFAEEKYKTPNMRESINDLLQGLGIGVRGLWYLSESGIENDPKYRGRGLSRVFHERRLAVASSLGLDALQRTTSVGNMYRTSKRTMTQIMGPAMQADPSTRKLLSTGEIINNVSDSENPARVLFAKYCD